MISPLLHLPFPYDLENAQVREITVGCAECIFKYKGNDFLSSFWNLCYADICEYPE